MSRRLNWLWLLAALFVAGCENDEQVIEPLASPTSEPTAALPKLPTLKLWLGPKELDTELALTRIQMQTGMMFRTNMGADEAMLFAFGRPHRASFWMKNTFVPLSAAYIAPDGTILEIHDLQPGNTNVVIASSDQIQYVLEVNRGWFARNNISTGAVARTERGSLAETFRRAQ